jgi:ubiquinone/menaquinone biosynthesis C-methylase UbiE
MTVKEHYDRHLGNFYSWMAGNFRMRVEENKELLTGLGINNKSGGTAIDLGAGHGIQSMALAELGFQVKAIDFNSQLLRELELNAATHDIEIIQADMLEYLQANQIQPDVITCMGDTLTHLKSVDECRAFLNLTARALRKNGKLVLSFRDLTHALVGSQRFIHVKSDDVRILTCFLEFFDNHVVVHDLLHEKIDGNWVQKVSSYPKLRLSEGIVHEMIQQAGLKTISAQIVNRFVVVVAEKLTY